MSPWDIAMEACQRHHASQKVDELAALLSLIQAKASWSGRAGPAVIVEIGCDAGGTLWAWRNAFPLAAVFGVTLEDNGPATGGQGFPVADHGAVVLFGDSHDRATKQRLKDQLGGRLVDVLLIDGDHTRGGVLADWNMYGPLVADGGLVVFHDVANDSPMTVGAVAVWEQMKREAAICGEPVTEIVSKAHRPVGFGILRKAWEKDHG